MTFQTLYRKWRPQTLSDVVGQEPIVQTLRNALHQGKVGHAYLFCGPRGTGKTSTGRILAKALNCEVAQGRDEPCNSCSACADITEGSFLDLVEIDAASNRGIDEIRDLREKVRFAPVRGRMKVYIIDEAHMLTAAAFNALLKTLEEPPEHVVLVLATTEPHSIPLTIASRCQRFDFRRISSSEAVERLGEICRAEGFSPEQEALRVVVQAAQGSLRDAENLLEQLLLLAGPQATAADARAFLGATGSGRAWELARLLLLEGDLSKALTALASLQVDGADLRQVHRELVEELRTTLLLQAGAGAALDLSEAELAERREAMAGMELGRVHAALEALAPLNIPPGGGSLPLEMAFVELMLKAGRRVLMPEWAETSEVLAEPQPSPQATRAAEEAEEKSVTPSSPEPPGETKATIETETKSTPMVESLKIPNVEQAVAGTTPAHGGHDIEAIRAQWREIVDAMRGVGSSGNLDAFLRSVSQPVAIEDGTLVVGFYYDFHKSKIEDPKYRHLVERKIAQVLGTHYSLRCELISKPQSKGHLVRAAISRGARPEPGQGGEDPS